MSISIIKLEFDFVLYVKLVDEEFEREHTQIRADHAKSAEQWQHHRASQPASSDARHALVPVAEFVCRHLSRLFLLFLLGCLEFL